MTIKADSTKIVQITSDAKTIFGLGSDEKMYQWNFLDSSWHLFAVQRERDSSVPTDKPGPQEAPTPLVPPTTPIA
jgi:hypothetical protein